MRTAGISLDKAELLSVLLEALLYGFSLLMFGVTIWTLIFQRTSDRVNHKMFIIACALLVISTAHLIIDIIRIMEGFISYRDKYPAGPVAYFSDVNHWTFVSKNNVFTAQMLVGDWVVLYRCYAVWQSKLVMILPVLLWCASAASGVGTTYTGWKLKKSGVFGGSFSQWLTAFWATALATNLFTTEYFSSILIALLVYRIWYLDWTTTKLCRNRQSQLRPLLHILIDAGAIYSFTLFVQLICFITESNGQYVVLDTITPIISITFYMVIIRVGLANRANRLGNIPLGYTISTAEFQDNAERRRTMQVHVTTLTESTVEQGRRPPTSSRSPLSSKDSPGGTKLDAVTREGEV